MKFLKKKSGFTLIELMVVITIIGIMGVMSIPAYLNSIKKAKYEEAVINAITMIKDARNTSIIGKIGTQSGTTLKGGYGVYIQKNVSGTGSFTFFQDSNENRIYNSSDQQIEIYTLPEEISIKSMSGSQSIDYSGISTNDDIETATILFLPPQGETILNENNTNKSLIEFNFILERYDQNKSKKLKINKISGFIESE